VAEKADFSVVAEPWKPDRQAKRSFYSKTLPLDPLRLSLTIRIELIRQIAQMGPGRGRASSSSAETVAIVGFLTVTNGAALVAVQGYSDFSENRCRSADGIRPRHSSTSA